MSLVQMNLSPDAITRTEKILAGISGGVEKAVRGAMQRATSNLQANSSKRIREHYAISHQNIRTNQTVKTRYSYQVGQGVSAEIVFSGHKIPLYRYEGASPNGPAYDTGREVFVLLNGWKRVHPGVSAAGHQLKGTAPTRFDHAFVARMSSGHTGIFERTGAVSASGRDQIRELFGSSVPQMLGSSEVAEKLAGDAARKFDERLDSEITRILNGF